MSLSVYVMLDLTSRNTLWTRKQADRRGRPLGHSPLSRALPAVRDTHARIPGSPVTATECSCQIEFAHKIKQNRARTPLAAVEAVKTANTPLILVHQYGLPDSR